MLLGFVEDLWHDSWVCKVGFDVQVSVAHWPIFDTASRRCYLITCTSELAGNKGTGARPDAKEKKGWLV